MPSKLKPESGVRGVYGLKLPDCTYLTALTHTAYDVERD